MSDHIFIFSHWDVEQVEHMSLQPGFAKTISSRFANFCLFVCFFFCLWVIFGLINFPDKHS